MSDDNDPFADLANDLDDDSASGDGAAAADSDGSASTSAGDASGEQSSGAGQAADADPRESPAFKWSQDMQHPIYVRDETWDEFEDVLLGVQYRLRREHGVKNVGKTELHDALLRTAAEDDLVAAVLEARGLDAEEE